MKFLLVAAAVLMSQPTWALYKCAGGGGSVSFQEQPCEAARTQTTIKPLVEAPKAAPAESAAPAAAAAAPATQAPAARPYQQQLKDMEAERLRTDAGYQLRDKTAELARHRDWCDNQQRQILANRQRANNNLAGAMYEQSVATEASAAATRCDTRARELQQDVEEARRQCAARGCS